MSSIDPRARLAELCAIPSVSGEEGEAADWVQNLCGDLGLETQRLGDSVVVRAGRKQGPRLLLNSHLDVVPAGEGWRADPFDARWRDGRLVARGANDAKASVIAMLSALAELKDEVMDGQLLLALTAQEETSNAGMDAVIAELGLPDGAVTGEPTGLEVVRAQSGLAVLVAEWAGKSCHAAHVATVEHESALRAAVTALAAQPEFWILPGEHPELGKSTLAPTVLRSGTRHNVVPDRAELVCDGRLAPPWDGEACRAFLEERLPGAKVTVRSDRLRAVETTAEHALVTLAVELAGKSRAIGSRTLSDMALLAGVPAVKCGPGRTERSHTPNEWIEESELLEACRFYSKFAPRALAALRSLEVNA